MSAERNDLAYVFHEVAGTKMFRTPLRLARCTSTLYSLFFLMAELYISIARLGCTFVLRSLVCVVFPLMLLDSFDQLMLQIQYFSVYLNDPIVT